MQLSKHNRLIMGLALFSMFFGAGNLIFPPYLAYQAGTATWPAMIGFCISAIGLPMLGVIAAVRAGGLDVLTGRVGRVFSQIYIILSFLAIGPGLAVPRNFVTSFEMAVLPFVGEDANIALYQSIYSLVFCVVVILIALKPEKLSNWFGKIMTPTLLVISAVILGACIFGTKQVYGAVSPHYQDSPAATGFLEGYQTMDAIASLNFGFLFALNLRARGVDGQKQLTKETVRAGWLAGFLLLLVYSALAHIGGIAGGLVSGATNGARTLAGIVGVFFGPVGNVILAVAFVVACLNTSLSLLTSCSDYFHKILPKISYRAFLIFFAVVSMIIANAGLNKILEISVPILGAIYPLCILLILLEFIHRWIKKFPEVYPVSVAVTTVVSVLAVLTGFDWCPGFIFKAIYALPFAEEQLAWIVPTVVSIFLGIIISLIRKKCRKAA
ncbi:MAG: branched-chain amino acid transport system II carrier protein [Candidatus Limivicinus sp.]